LTFKYFLHSQTYSMLQGDGEAGEVFEKRLLGGRIELLFVINPRCSYGEFSAVFFPVSGALANVPCLFKPSFFTDFLKEPRQPVLNEDYSNVLPGYVCELPAMISGSALQCELSANPRRYPAAQTDPVTPTKHGCRLRTCFPPSCKWFPGVYRNLHRSNCIPRRVPQLQLAPSK
jgi:hypothetical protein